MDDNTSSILLSKQLEEENLKEQASAEKELKELLEQVSDVKSGVKDDENISEDDFTDIEDFESSKIEAEIDALLKEHGIDKKVLEDDENKLLSEPKADDVTEPSTATNKTEPSSINISTEDEPMLEEPKLETPVEENAVDQKESSIEEQENPVNDILPTSDATKDSADDTAMKDPEPAKDIESIAAKDSELAEEELREDDLLEDCASSDVPIVNENVKPSESETSSSNGDTPEESDAEKQSLNQVHQTETVDEVGDITSEKMDIDDNSLIGSPKPDDNLLLCVVMEEDEKPSELKFSKLEPSEPVKFNFMRKFASKIGKLSRSELEELLVQKIAEAMVFGSDNSELRTRIENQEKINEGIKKQLENVKKQYKDLQMIHERVMKDLKDRPEAPITPVKITRAVGLQVYQPAIRGKNVTPPQTTPTMTKRSHESPVNGTSPPGPDAKRKKTVKTTPLRPPLSDKARAALARQEATEELKLRTKTMKTVMNVNVPSSITVVPLNSLQNGNKGSSIDLTDDVEEGSSNKTKAHQPPPLTAIRAAMAAGKSVPVPKMPTAQSAQVRTNQVRSKFAILSAKYKKFKLNNSKIFSSV